MNPIILIVIGLSFAIPLGASQSPDTLDLEQFLTISKNRNPLITSAQWYQKIAEAELNKVKRMRILPKIRLRSESGIVPDAKGDIFNPPSDTLGLRPVGPFNRTQIEAIQPIYPISRGRNYLTAAKNSVAIANAKQKSTISNVNYEIKKYYHASLLARDLFTLAERLRKEIAIRSEEIESASNLTISGPYELNLAALEIDILAREAHDQMVLAHQALLVSAGFSVDDQIEIAAKFIAPVEIHNIDFSTLEKIAVESSPEWQELQAGITATKALYHAARNAYKPDVYIAGGIRYAIAPGRTDQRNPFVRDEFNSFGGGIFLGVKQTLEFHLIGADIDRAEAKYRQLTSIKDGMKNKIRIDVSKKINSFHREKENLTASTKRRKIAQQWLKDAKDEYEFDPETIKDLIKAFQKWAEVERQYLDRIYQFNLSVAALEKAFNDKMISNENATSLPSN